MKLCDGIHQIRIDFQVTPQVKRYVYVYLIEAKNCYLIDSGVAGSEGIISEYMKHIGRELSEIKGIFLTHAHPDHIGGAAKLKALTGCRIYASAGERRWMEELDLQYRERPIPNFYELTGTESVPVDTVAADGDIICLEEHLQMEVISTSGHSMDDLSFLLREKGVVFTGDAIPVEGDIPIYIDDKKSIESLERLGGLSDRVHLYCPAWDKAYPGEEGSRAVERGIALIRRLGREIAFLRQEYPNAAKEQYVELLCEKMGTPQFLQNPLFRRTVLSYLDSQSKEKAENRKIEEQFNMIAQEYDCNRKKFIPCFEEYYKKTTEFIAANISCPKRILDLGAGTGLLSHFWYQQFPQSEYVLVDVADEMLKIAEKRFAGLGNIRYQISDYSKELPEEEFDCIISALSIHHLEHPQKLELFRRIYEKLPEHGIFVNYDQFCAASDDIGAWFDSYWENELKNRDLTPKDLELWKERRKLDRECSVEDEIRFLKESGFGSVECLYSNQKFSVIIAVK